MQQPVADDVEHAADDGDRDAVAITLDALASPDLCDEVGGPAAIVVSGAFDRRRDHPRGGNVDSVSDIENGLGGWSGGDADVATPFGLSPDSRVLARLPQALANGWQLGVANATQDLQNPETSALIPGA